MEKQDETRPLVIPPDCDNALLKHCLRTIQYRDLPRTRLPLGRFRPRTRFPSATRATRRPLRLINRTERPPLLGESLGPPLRFGIPRGAMARHLQLPATRR